MLNHYMDFNVDGMLQKLVDCIMMQNHVRESKSDMFGSFNFYVMIASTEMIVFGCIIS